MFTVYTCTISTCYIVVVHNNYCTIIEISSLLVVMFKQCFCNQDTFDLLLAPYYSVLKSIKITDVVLVVQRHQNHQCFCGNRVTGEHKI